MAINPENLKKIQAAVASSLNEQWGLFLSEGIVLVILGIIALLLPAVATFAVAIVIGWKVPKYSVACR
jgi:uncharacterized membrane protein HdeD (DUF308 family)